MYMSHLSYDSAPVSGNNPFNLNRMTVDNRYRNPSSASSLANVIGYSATGEIIHTGSAHNPFLESRGDKDWSQYKRPMADLLPANAGAMGIGVYNQVAYNQNSGSITTPYPQVQEHLAVRNHELPLKAQQQRSLYVTRPSKKEKKKNRTDTNR